MAPPRAVPCSSAWPRIYCIYHPDAAGLARIGQLLRKYESPGPDWADACLVWLPEHLGTRRIATIDVKDFSVYRIDWRNRFELELLG